MDNNELIEILKKQLKILECTQEECQKEPRMESIPEILQLSAQIESIVRTIIQIPEKVVIH